MVGAEFAAAREPHGDHGGEQAEHDFQHHHDDVVAETTALALAVAGQEAVHHAAHHARQHDDEGVQHALQQGHGHHVAVGDVRHLMAQHGLGLVLVHRTQQAGRHRHQGIVAVGAGGEGIDLRRIVDGDFRHADTGRLGLALHGGHQPALGIVARLLDHLGAGGALGHPLGGQQRDQRSAEAEDGGEDQQPSQLVGVDPQQRHDDAGQDQHGEAGGEEQGDTREHGGAPEMTCKDGG